MPTITEEQANQIRQHLERKAVLEEQMKGVYDLWNSPQWGHEAKALWKKAYPQSQIEGYDQEQRVKGYIDDFEKKQEDAKREAQIKERSDRLASQREEVRNRGNYTEDGMKMLEKMMHERDIIDYEAGDLLFRQKNPPPPTDGADSADSHYWNYDKQPQPNAQLLASDPEKWGFEELVPAIKKDAQQRFKF